MIAMYFLFIVTTVVRPVERAKNRERESARERDRQRQT
jgi:hypothetical protein